MFAYRALSKEYHDKISSLKVVEKVVGYLKKQDYKKIKELFPKVQLNDSIINELESRFGIIADGSKSSS